MPTIKEGVSLSKADCFSTQLRNVSKSAKSLLVT